MKTSLSLVLGIASILFTGCGGTEPATARLASAVSADITYCTFDTPPMSSPFELTVEGNGALQVGNGGNIYLLKTGTFILETTPAGIVCFKYLAHSGFITTKDGERLMGYTPDDNGVFSKSLSELNIFQGLDMPSSDTRNIIASLVLDSSVSPLPASAFSPKNAATYHSSASLDVYDTIGFSHQMTMFFVRTAMSTWEVFFVVADAIVSSGQLSFTENGDLAATLPSQPLRVAFPASLSAATPHTVNADFSGTTVRQSKFAIYTLTQDGYRSGTVNGVTINDTGQVISRFTNGRTRVTGQIAFSR